MGKLPINHIAIENLVKELMGRFSHSNFSNEKLINNFIKENYDGEIITLDDNKFVIFNDDEEMAWFLLKYG